MKWVNVASERDDDFFVCLFFLFLGGIDEWTVSIAACLLLHRKMWYFIYVEDFAPSEWPTGI